MRDDPDLKIFSGASNKPFTEKICGYLNAPIGLSRTIKFSDGNTYVKIDEKVRGKDVYIVQTIGLDSNNDFMELLFWLDAFNRSGAHSITAIIPYFSYAKADKKDEPRVSIRARVCADCLETAGVDRIVTMDLHSPQIQGFFKKPVDHLYASTIFIKYIEQMGILGRPASAQGAREGTLGRPASAQGAREGIGDFVIVSPDEGFAKNARYYANRLNVPLAIGNKQRVSHDENAQILGIIGGSVEGKAAIIVDDFTISCGTLVETAKTLAESGAKEIYAFVSHCLISQKGIDALENSNITTLFTTDTVFDPLVAQCEKITVISVAELFAKAIRIIHENDSLSELFK